MARKIKISVLSGDKPMRYHGENDCMSAITVMKQYWDRQLKQAVSEKSDIVLLPEDCDRYQEMDSRLISAYHHARLKEMPEFFSSYAKMNHINILYSAIRENTNSIIFFNKEGRQSGRYDKMFPTIWEIDDGICPGSDAKVFPVDKIKNAGFAICFDLNFDELRESYVRLQPEVIFFSSMFHGGVQQAIWAYTTRAFFVSAIFGNQSRIMAPNNRVLASTTNYNNHCSSTINLDSKMIHLDYNILKFEAIKQKYGDGVIIDDTGYLASVMIYNENEDITIDDILQEFQLETLDDYFKRSRKKRTDAL